MKELDVMDGKLALGARAGISNDFELGQRLKWLRTSKKMTIATLSTVAGVAKSTISKIESGQMSPTFDVIQKICKGLDKDVASFFNDSNERASNGRRSVTRRGQAKVNENDYYSHQLLCTELAQKKMFTALSRIKARSVSEFKTWINHDGEEFFYVVSGTVTVHSEFYEPLALNEGDAMYFDCSMQHATISTSEEDAQVLWVFCG